MPATIHAKTILFIAKKFKYNNPLDTVFSQNIKTMRKKYEKTYFFIAT